MVDTLVRLQRLHQTRSACEQRLADEIRLVFRQSWFQMQMTYKAEDFWRWYHDGLESAVERGLIGSVDSLLQVDEQWFAENGLKFPKIGSRQVYDQYVVDTRFRFRRLTDASALAIEKKVRAWIASGGSPDELYERLAQYFSDDRAKRIAMTELTALNSARIKSLMRSMGVTEWVWRVNPFSANPCDDCLERDGEVYTTRHHFPPEHPNCRCEAEPMYWGE